MSRTLLTLALCSAMAGCSIFGGASAGGSSGTNATAEGGFDPTVGGAAESSQPPPTQAPDSSLEGLTLAQRNFARTANASFQEVIDSVREECGWAPESQIVWRTFADEITKSLAGEQSVGYYGYCGVPLETIERYCRNGNTDAANAARARVVSYRCEYGGVGGRAARFDRTQLTYKVDWAASNNDQFVQEFLGNNL